MGERGRREVWAGGEGSRERIRFDCSAVLVIPTDENDHVVHGLAELFLSYFFRVVH